MLKVFKHNYKKDTYVMADVIRGKVVENSHGYITVYSVFPFDTVRSDIFNNDYKIDETKSNKNFISKLKNDIRIENLKHKKKMEKRYDKY